MNPNITDVPPTAQDSLGADSEMTDSDKDWLRLARASYQTSTSYMDSNYRKSWEDGLRAFNSQHSSDSKYNSPAYDKRSRLFRPKIRSIIRKNEAAAAAAFFSSLEVTSVTAMDQSNPQEVASAEINKSLLQYRLTKTIPWFQIVLGGLQDAQSVGVACAHVYWRYKPARKSSTPSQPVAQLKPVEDGEYPEQARVPPGAFVASAEQSPRTMGSAEPAPPPPEQEAPIIQQARQIIANKESKPIFDKPCVDLIPVENLRIDPSADWTNPIESSPYVIHLIPMYMMDVKDRMASEDWRQYGDGQLQAACSTVYDSTRAARLTNREDPFDAKSSTFSGYEIVWVQRHIHRRDDEDWEFYTLGDFALLTDPVRLKEVVFHGKRPYVMGCCILEAHKTYPSSVGQLGKDLQNEANEVANQRIDNVKFVLNKKWFVKRGKEADIAGLVRNVPGGIVMLDDPEKDVREVTWPDVTASAYEEQSRIDNDMNDLLGNFSVGQVMAEQTINGPARNMQMLGQSSGTLVEYLLRTYVETFVQPVLRQIMLLEQSYETDTVILALAAKTADLHQKYGIDQVTDELIEQELNLTVNVGMGATDPVMKSQRFLGAVSAYIEMLAKAPPGLNMAEVGKEIFGHAGYQDGARFLTQENAQVLQLQQKLQEAGGIIQQQQQQLKDKSEANQVKDVTNQRDNETKILTTKMHEEANNLRNATTHMRAIREADAYMRHEMTMHESDKSDRRQTMKEGKK